MHQPVAETTATARFRPLLRFAEALAAGACGGFLFNALGLPAGFLSGAMLAVAIVALAGRPVTMPQSVMPVMMVVFGISFGSVATPEMMHGMASYPVSLGLLGIGTVAVALGGMVYLRYVHGWSMSSALLGSTPGALTQMVVLAIETKSDQVGVAIVQTLRVVLLAVSLPIGLALAGLSIDAAGPSRLVAAELSALPLLIGVSVAGGYIFHRIKFPGGWLFGAMLGSGLLHAFSIVHGGLPFWVLNVAMVCMGTMVGTRFAAIGWSAFVRYLAAGFGSLIVSLVIMAGFLLLTVQLANVPAREVTMAFAPGAMDVMMAVALTLHLDPIFVGAHHLFRFLGVSLLMPLIVRVVAPKATEIPESEI